MHLIVGATGHVGSVLTQELLRRGEPVTVLSHSPDKVQALHQQGARVALVNVHDVERLRAVFRQGQRLFLLNPPADPATDTAREERRTMHALFAALQDSGLEKIVAQSTYGAQPGEQVGDLGVLFELEQALAAQLIPVSVLRAAYFMSNWNAAFATAQQEGVVRSFYPVDFALPMVAPQDIAQVAADLLLKSIASTGLHYVEGPAHYSATDVAAAFATALGKPVKAAEIPQTEWVPTLRTMGFSESAATSFAGMTAATLGAQELSPPTARRGPTSLQQYVDELVHRA